MKKKAGDSQVQYQSPYGVIKLRRSSPPDYE